MWSQVFILRSSASSAPITSVTDHLTPPPSSPRWWLHLHTRTSSTVVKTFGVNIQEEIVGGRPRYSVHLLMSYTAPFVKIFESNLFPADQARLQNVVQISL